MQIKIAVSEGEVVGIAWCDVFDEDNGLPLRELVERYVLPAFATAWHRAKDEKEHPRQA